MTRIAKKFRQLKKDAKKALITFITTGDPDLAETARLVETLESSGADIIELGVPFSDPMADGAVIQQASERALKKGVTLEKILNLVGKVRKKSEIPILLMGYYNPIFVMGHELFAEKAGKAGVDGVLVVDLPPEEAKPLRDALGKNGIDLVFLLAPTSGPERIKKILRQASGFVYYVSLTGVTGAELNVTNELKTHLAEIRKASRLPVAVGFGISEPKKARQVSEIADGIVVGSALVKIISKAHGNKLHSRVRKFVSSLRCAIDSAT